MSILPSADETHWAESPRPPHRSRGLAIATGLLLVAAFVGYRYANRPEAPARAAPATLSYYYQATSDDGYMNQQLAIINHTGRSLLPVLEIQAVDRGGHVLRDISVTTVYGSDRGMLVVPPDGNGDVLVFTGPDRLRVADVVVTARRVEEIDFPSVTRDIQAQPLDARGGMVTRNDRFESVTLMNRNASTVTVRLVYIVWDEPPIGLTQQAQLVVPVGDLVTVPGMGYVTVPMTGTAAAANKRIAGSAPTSIKAYLSPGPRPSAPAPAVNA